MEAAYQLAPPSFEHRTRCGEYDVAFQFENARLAEKYFPSLIRREARDPQLVIRVLTRESIDLDSLAGELQGRTQTVITNDHFALWSSGPSSVLYVFDRKFARGLVWLPEGNAPAWELSRPGAPIFQAMLARTPWLATHGAAVSRNGKTLLLAGKGKSGKSTAALSCAAAGWDYGGDDYVLTNSQTMQTEPLYASARLRNDMAPAFKDILPQPAFLSNEDGEVRHELRLDSYFGTERIRGGKIAAILLPRRQGALSPKFEKARPAHVFDAMFSTVLVGAPLKVIAAKLSSLIFKAPLFYVDTGGKPAAIPDAFEEFLRSLER